MGREKVGEGEPESKQSPDHRRWGGWPQSSSGIYIQKVSSSCVKNGCNRAETEAGLLLRHLSGHSEWRCREVADYWHIREAGLTGYREEETGGIEDDIRFGTRSTRQMDGHVIHWAADHCGQIWTVHLAIGGAAIRNCKWTPHWKPELLRCANMKHLHDKGKLKAL